jgi:hypothetical protein
MSGVIGNEWLSWKVRKLPVAQTKSLVYNRSCFGAGKTLL